MQPAGLRMKNQPGLAQSSCLHVFSFLSVWTKPGRTRVSLFRVNRALGVGYLTF